MKILNLYACLGGNRYKWDEVAEQAGIEIEVTAIELDEELAKLYQERFPTDQVIVADAHEYLLKHFSEYDFVWSSPPCPTHSKIRVSQKNRESFEHKYPDMKLYEEVIFLQNFHKGLFCVENVTPYYEPLIPAQKVGRHLYWTNFSLGNNLNERKEFNGIMCAAKNEVAELSKMHDYDFRKYKGNQRIDKIARNLVDYEVGKAIMQRALNLKIENNSHQIELF